LTAAWNTYTPEGALLDGAIGVVPLWIEAREVPWDGLDLEAPAGAAFDVNESLSGAVHHLPADMLRVIIGALADATGEHET
jgi:hypothetical protein